MLDENIRFASYENVAEYSSAYAGKDTCHYNDEIVAAGGIFECYSHSDSGKSTEAECVDGKHEPVSRRVDQRMLRIMSLDSYVFDYERKE